MGWMWKLDIGMYPTADLLLRTPSLHLLLLLE